MSWAGAGTRPHQSAWGMYSRGTRYPVQSKKGRGLSVRGHEMPGMPLVFGRRLGRAGNGAIRRRSAKRGDFIHWCELIANHIAAGSTSESIRTYLKQVSKTTWQLVNWLTHSHHAGKLDGVIATEATENVMQTFIVAWARFEEPKRAAEKKRRRGRPPAKTE